MSSAPILWIDNDPVIREMPAHVPALQERGIRWAESLAKVKEDIAAGRFSLIIADLRAGRFDGKELLETIGRTRTPMILTTTEGSVRDAVGAMQAGAADYLLKPFHPDVLAAAIGRIDAMGRPASPGPAPRFGATGLTPTAKEIITGDPAMERLLKTAENVAPSTATVLILGESGTGKELLAAYIHRRSPRAGGPFVAMNCAALPDTLAESELFGHEKGAFTGALHRKPGKFELANGGTLMLDEIGEMPLGLQAKLLRVLQERRVDRVGGREPVPVDVRIIAASNVDLARAVDEGKFREDLYYRINVIPLTLPPLRHRHGDVAPLAAHFLDKYRHAHGRRVDGIDDAAMARLGRHRWRGNVRELENVMERAVLVCAESRITVQDLMLGDIAFEAAGDVVIEAGVSVREMEQALIASTLRKVNGNRTHAAEMLGISIRTLRNKLREYKEKDAA